MVFSTAATPTHRITVKNNGIYHISVNIYSMVLSRCQNNGKYYLLASQRGATKNILKFYESLKLNSTILYCHVKVNHCVLLLFVISALMVGKQMSILLESRFNLPSIIGIVNLSWIPVSSSLCDWIRAYGLKIDELT